MQEVPVLQCCEPEKSIRDLPGQGWGAGGGVGGFLGLLAHLQQVCRAGVSSLSLWCCGSSEPRLFLPDAERPV